MKIPLSGGDECVGVFDMDEWFLVVTKQGRLYRLEIDENDFATLIRLRAKSDRERARAAQQGAVNGR